MTPAATADLLRPIIAFSQSKVIAALSALLGDGAALHLVGGAVRDLLSGKTPTDIDVTTKLYPEVVAERLTQHGIRVIETGIAHGTVTALIPEIEDSLTPVEITTFRKAGTRLANSYSKSIEEDLTGRDFTINAIAFELLGQKLVDPFGGAADLAANLLRGVADPEARFREDPLRVLRMIRFGPAAGRSIEDQTRSAAKICAPLLSEISPERIRTELEAILLSPFVRKAFHLMLELGILHTILPEILPAVQCDQNEFHVEDVFEHTLTVVERAAPDTIVKFAALFHDFGKPHTLTTDAEGRRHFYLHEEVSATIARTVMERLRFSNEAIEQVVKLVALHMRPITCGAPGVRRIIKSTDTLFDKWRLLKLADAPPVMESAEFAKELARFDEMVQVERNRKVGSPFSGLAIGGAEILALGIKPGPVVGHILKALNELVLDTPELNTVAELTKKAKELIQAD